jgi:hypothetical protein
MATVAHVRTSEFLTSAPLAGTRWALTQAVAAPMRMLNRVTGPAGQRGRRMAPHRRDEGTIVRGGRSGSVALRVHSASGAALCR